MDFALILFVALVITGAIWAADRAFLAPRRRRLSERLQRDGKPEEVVAHAAREPLLVEYARSFFPVILVVFLLRSFLVEPFRIPSGSMLPSLLVGDFILVNKFAYGIRLPVVHEKIADVGKPERGDVVVFRFPAEPSDNYIKRVIGVPGDRIAYRDKQLFINGERVPRAPAPAASGAAPVPLRINEYVENLYGVEHAIWLTENLQQDAMEFSVPPGHYFVMGDNRDQSNDSRYWGYVPEGNLVGKAFLIWFSWDAANGGGVNWGRIGDRIH